MHSHDDILPTAAAGARRCPDRCPEQVHASVTLAEGVHCRTAASCREVPKHDPTWRSAVTRRCTSCGPTGVWRRRRERAVPVTLLAAAVPRPHASESSPSENPPPPPPSELLPTPPSLPLLPLSCA